MSLTAANMGEKKKKEEHAQHQKLQLKTKQANKIAFHPTIILCKKTTTSNVKSLNDDLIEQFFL